MNAIEIVGYTGDASVWCPDCAIEKYGHVACGLCPNCGAFISSITQDTCYDCCYDYADHPTTDEDGNPVHPVFACDEWDYQPHCDGCGDEIDVIILNTAGKE